jgi:hypothetical protein
MLNVFPVKSKQHVAVSLRSVSEKCLPFGPLLAYFSGMTARGVIDQIKALPPEEQAKVIEFLEEVKTAQRVGTMSSKTFEEAAKRVFDRHAELMQKLSQ